MHLSQNSCKDTPHHIINGFSYNRKETQTSQHPATSSVNFFVLVFFFIPSFTRDQSIPFTQAIAEHYPFEFKLFYACDFSPMIKSIS